MYFDGMIREIASDLETFYVKAFLKALSGENRSIERNFRFLPILLGYRGKMEIEELMNFLEAKFARKHIPVIPLRMLSTPECFKKP